MGKFASGKHALAISDRSGMQFPYPEMVFEWTGAFVHISEWEAKQPQINPKLVSADPVALRNPRPLHRSGILVQLDPAAWFAINGNINPIPSEAASGSGSMQPPQTANEANKKRQARITLANVTVSIT